MHFSLTDEHIPLSERIRQRLVADSSLAHLDFPPIETQQRDTVVWELVTDLHRTPSQIATMIDHTLLRPDATPQQIEQLCAEANAYQFASVCIAPCFVSHAAQLLAGSDVMVTSVVGFPLGSSTTATKVFEAQQACDHGAHELDMVLPIGLLKAGDFAAVADDIAQVVEVCHVAGARCKIILETALLSVEEIVIGCLLAHATNADFVKTSTGIAHPGATRAAVASMAATVGGALGIKASGGIRTFAGAYELVVAGATRIGTSASVYICQEAHTHTQTPPEKGINIPDGNSLA